jgi:hypothetical protein
MLALHPQYINDAHGNPVLVVLPKAEFEAVLEQLEDLEDIRLYDEAKLEDDGERISFADYLQQRGVGNA